MTAPSGGFTCVTCRLLFSTAAQQREHYACEWHRYNAKRQIAALAPLSESQFLSKVESFNAEAKAAECSSETVYCKLCKKKFRSQNAFTNHLSSKRHRVNAELCTNEDDADMFEKTVTTSPIVADNDSEELSSDEEIELDESKALPENSCLFCSCSRFSIDDTLQHMADQHGFFIPDAQYCFDVHGLLKYLRLKVGAGHFCIRCSKNRFRDLASCQLHMRDKAHVTYSLEGDGLLEFLDFYDYGELLVDEDEEDTNVAVDLGYTLVLPSGAKLGHRSLRRFYNQRLRSDDEQRRVEAGRLAAKSRVEQKSLGWVGVSGPASVQRARDIKFMQKIIRKGNLSKCVKSNKLFKTKGRADQM